MAPEPRRIIEEGVAEGLYATPIPLQIFAYKTQQILMTNAARTTWGKQSLLGGRILELLRIRSAQLGECQPCMQSRKHDSITEEDVACLISPGGSELNEQERLAVEFLDLLSADHHAIDADFYRRLGEHFTSAQIVERGCACANSMGLHRFIHTLDVFGQDPPVIPYSPDQVDSAIDEPVLHS
jgi:alkylhydroperoxidase family enzyme